eukprot:12562814-Ditylum_brightwellii.AAC.1
MEKYPELYIWKEKKASAPFTLSHIYHFIAILYYMGVVNLPSKDEIHVEEEKGSGKENISEEEDMTDELYLEHVACDEEKDDCESDKEDEEDCNASESDEGSP